ncbi:hypothetical protein [Hyalangium rubrum]|uniref:4-vinyl reductase 4VR domain-containing protein n=1 Tax=Hyalangium rubrum TaxID=3103134 RepID=A0ABU5H7A0_9BACT|nr:hypothetical protein [Hyalangium sp. s54d21]MDY7229356.1 hypothetical protein [Hyalangium sp. s54d21]
MVKNRDDFKDYQVLGANLQNIMGGFGSFTLIASKFLLEEGIGTADEMMMVQFKPDGWYPLDRFLRVFDRIHAEFGNFTLRQVGVHVPKNAVFPPQVTDLLSAFKTMDMGYYMNHGYKGQPLFNPDTGEMKEGIGHYKPTVGAVANRITVESTTSYPCPFEEGMVTALAQRFKPTAIVTHDKSNCRSRNGSSCVYSVSWK